MSAKKESGRLRPKNLRVQLLSALAGFAILAALGAGARAATVVNSKHNLSVSGPGEVKALSEDQICIFCHTPHGARTSAPLWNRRDSASTYIPYDSPTLKAQPGQPTGSSKLCLSCHDGTVALGDLLSEEQPISMIGGGLIPPGGSRIGTDLRDDHPVSFNYYDAASLSAGKLTSPGAWDPRVELDDNSELQCTTCHDPHDDQWGQFLVMDNRFSALCRECHSFARFPQTPHADSLLPWNGSGQDPWPRTDYPDVRTNACQNCHFTHAAGGPEELLSSSMEEEVCFACHNGNVTRFNLQAVFQKPYSHPVEQFQGDHEAGESPRDAASHVECVDCHNPHEAERSPAVPPFAKGVQRGVSGIDISGSPVDRIANEYELCFKCHADGGVSPFNAIPRQIPSVNTRKEFDPSATSFHPVASPGVNFDVPSLISPLNPGSMIFCTDCHANDGARGGIVGSFGPHGSNYEFILAKEYRTGDNVAESPSSYALCYECHSRSSILAGDSFSLHSLHIADERTSCSVCHDPHGIDVGQGNPANNARLMNFDISVVEADPVTGRREYVSFGGRSGQCFLRCHGVDHSPETYP